jgi:hypothetical protein
MDETGLPDWEPGFGMKLTRLYAWVVIEEDGGESLCGGLLPGRGMVALMGHQRRDVVAMTPLAKRISNESGRPVVLRAYREGETIECIQPETLSEEQLAALVRRTERIPLLPVNTPPRLTPDDVARLWNVESSVVEGMLYRGELRSVKLGEAIRIPLPEILRFENVAIFQSGREFRREVKQKQTKERAKRREDARREADRERKAADGP